MTETIYAIIPARQGSKGVPNKNIKTLGGHPLIAYSIAAAKMCPEVSRVLVSTDSSEYAALAIKYGAEVPFLRPSELAGDKSPDIDLFKHCLNWFKEKEKVIPDFMLHLRPTTPLRDPLLISSALRKLSENVDATSLRSAHLSPETPLKWFKQKQGYFTTLSDEMNIETLNRPRQDFPDVYVPDGYVDVIRSRFVTEKNQMHGDRVLSFESPYCVEVDSLDEFQFLEYTLQKQGSVIKDYLDKLTL